MMKDWLKNKRPPMAAKMKEFWQVVPDVSASNMNGERKSGFASVKDLMKR